MAITFAIAPSPLGRFLVAATERGLCSVRFGEMRRAGTRSPRRVFRRNLYRDDAALAEYIDPLLAGIRGENPTIDLPLDIRATAFQMKVWEALRNIPSGETRSYSDVARELGEANAVRAVARACAANPVALAVPCHRVVRTDGNLSVYRWGVERKRKLLERERATS